MLCVQALQTLAAFHLVQQRRGRWTIVATTSLTLLAGQIGVYDTITALIARNRDERAAYRRLLRIADSPHPPPRTYPTGHSVFPHPHHRMRSKPPSAFCSGSLAAASSLPDHPPGCC